MLSLQDLEQRNGAAGKAQPVAGEVRAAAVSIEKSGPTMAGDLPPSSSVTGQ